MPNVSVILPVYNGSPYVYEALQSMLDQTYTDYEVLLIDDGSTDKTLEIIDQLSSNKLRIISKPNSGLVDSLNLGLTRVDCKYVVRMDADDVSFPHRIKSQVDFMDLCGVSASSCGSIFIDEAGRVTSQYIPEDIRKCNSWWLPAAEPYLPHPFLIFRLNSVLELGGYRHVLYAEDADLYWRLLDRGPIINMQDFLGKYRVHGASVSGANPMNSRIQSVFSQAAAISAQRRSAGKTDLVFNITMEEAKKKAETLEGVAGLLRNQLKEVEWNHLCAAAGLKLLEFANWRPFEISSHDVYFTRYYVERVDYMHSYNRMGALKVIEDTMERLASKS